MRYFRQRDSKKLQDRKIDFKYDKQHFTIQCEIFKIVGLPIYTGSICNLGIENADYVVRDTAYPNYETSVQEYFEIMDRLDYIFSRFRGNPKEKSEREIEELFDILIEV